MREKKEGRRRSRNGLALLITIIFVIGFVSIYRGGVHLSFFGTNISSNNTLVSEKTAEITDIKQLAVEISADEAEIIPTDEAKVTVKQFANKESKKNQKVKLEKQGQKLTIKIPRKLSFFQWFNTSQRLEIYVPRAYAEELKLQLSSGEIALNEGDFKKVKLDVASGKLTASNVTTDDLEIDLSSGDITIDNAQAKKVNYQVASGELQGENIKMDSFKGKISSGDIELSGIIKAIKTDISSGKVELDNQVLPDSLTVEVSSGNFELALPKNNGFQLDYKLSSGSIENDFTNHSLEKKGIDSYKTGGPTYYLDVKSGSISFNQD